MVVVTVASVDGAALKVGSATPNFTSFSPVLAATCCAAPALTAPASLVPAEPITQPDTPPAGAPPAEWLRYHQQMIVFLEWQRDIEQWRGSVEDRLESVEELTRLVPEILERLGPATLSPEHQRSIQAAVKRLHDLTGIAFAAVYDELRDAFHVGTYKEILDSQWNEVATWF